MDDWLDQALQLPADVKRADALWSVHLVRRQTDQISHNADAQHIHSARRLRGITVQEHSVLAGNRMDLRQVLDCPDFAVHQTDRNDKNGGTNLRKKVLKVEMPVGIDTQMRNCKATVLKHSADREHGFVIGRADQDLTALPRGRACGKTEQSKIVRFRGT